MSWGIEFGTKSEADTVREDYADLVCPLDDDRRRRTVAFVEDVDDETRRELEMRAAAGRGDRQAGPGQIELTDDERDRLDFSVVDVPTARSVKGIALDAGVDDWTAHLDPTLTVDEHREVMERAARDERGTRLDEQETDEQRAARLEAQQDASECNHARGACEHGNPEACEFLGERCGADEEEIATLLDYADAVPYDELDGETKGALSRAWSGYTIGVRRLSALLDDVHEELRRTEQAAGAIRALEEGISDADTGELEALAGHHRTLAALARQHPDATHGQRGSDAPTDEQLRERRPATERPMPPGQPSRPLDEMPATDPRAAHITRDDELEPPLVDDRDEFDEDEGLFEHTENAPDEGDDGPSREHLRAQNGGYLRSGSRGFDDDASAREGLGRYTATGGERTLDQYEDDS